MLLHWHRPLTTLPLVASLLAGLFLNSPSAAAAGRIALSVQEGTPGDTVTLNASGLVSRMQVAAYFSSDPAVPGNEIDVTVKSYTLIGQSQTDDTASATFTFAIPTKLSDGAVQKTVGCGDYYIYVVFTGSKQIQAVASFFVLGPVIANPSRGRIGDSVTISGTGLKASEMAYIYFSSNRALPGSAIGSQVTIYEKSDLVVVTKEGTMTALFQIPSRLTEGKMQEDVHGGDYYFYLTYTTATIQTMTRFTVLNGEMKVEPVAGVVGAEVKISGEGLRPNQNITANYDDRLALVKSGDTATDSAGKFSATIAIPESVAGSHKITVADVTGNKPETWFTVNPALSLADSARLGDVVQVSGTGFGEAVDIAVTVGGQPVSTNPPIISTNRKGSFSGSFGVPQPAGTVSISVTDSLGNKCEKTLIAVALPSGSASLSLTPATSQGSPGFVGQKIAVSGSKFSPASTVTLTFGKNQTPIGSPKTDASGSFETQFTVPPTAAGQYQILASDGPKQAAANFVLENNAPPPPQPVQPQAAAEVKALTRFEWAAVSDPSGVKYILQVSADSTFASPLIQKTELIQSWYAPTETERRQVTGNSQGYYWRVRAIDGAANVGPWSPPILFFVGSSESAMPPWIIYAMIGLGVALLVILILWLRQVVASRRA